VAEVRTDVFVELLAVVELLSVVELLTVAELCVTSEVELVDVVPVDVWEDSVAWVSLFEVCVEVELLVDVDVEAKT
jgi:hypothetical protein